MALIEEEFVRVSLRSEVFRISFEEPFRAIFALALIGVISWSAWQGYTNFMLYGLIIPLLTGVLAVIGTIILRSRYTFQISPQGLTCYDFWGWKRTTHWADMKSATRFQLAGLGYVRLQSNSRRSVIWLPLFVEDLPLLCDLVGAHVSAGHPLFERLLEWSAEINPDRPPHSMD